MYIKPITRLPTIHCPRFPESPDPLIFDPFLVSCNYYSVHLTLDPENRTRQDQICTHYLTTRILRSWISVAPLCAVFSGMMYLRSVRIYAGTVLRVRRTMYMGHSPHDPWILQVTAYTTVSGYNLHHVEISANQHSIAWTSCLHHSKKDRNNRFR